MHVNIDNGGDPNDYTEHLNFVVNEVAVGSRELTPELEQRRTIMTRVVDTILRESTIGATFVGLRENEWSGARPPVGDTNPCTIGFDFDPVNLSRWTILLLCQYFVREWFNRNVNLDLTPGVVLAMSIMRMYGNNHLNHQDSAPLRNDMNLWYHIGEYVMGGAYDSDLDDLYAAARLRNILHVVFGGVDENEEKDDDDGPPDDDDSADGSGSDNSGEGSGFPALLILI